ncbi:MAG: VOC family protein [Chloroflexota bacterium]
MITGIGHAAFGVRDVETSLHFYCDILGFQRAFELKNVNPNRPPSDIPQIYYLLIGNGQFVELFPAPPAADKPAGAEKPAGNSGSYRHLQFEVDDMQSTIATLESRGLPPSPNPPRLGKDGNWQYWITDPDGNRFELMQIMPDSLHADAISRLQTSATR